MYNQFHYDFFLAYFCLHFISLILATEGLVFETDGNQNMLDMFWPQRRYISPFIWHQQYLVFVASMMHIWRYELFK